MMPFRSLVPYVHVVSVPASIAFYEKLGFTVGNTYTFPGANELTWAWLRCGNAQLMIARSSGPIVPEEQAVFFYLYVEDVAAKHAELAANGVTVGAITYPFYCPRGEFRVVDPDGYGLMIAHT